LSRQKKNKTAKTGKNFRNGVRKLIRTFPSNPSKKSD